MPGAAPLVAEVLQSVAAAGRVRRGRGVTRRRAEWADRRGAGGSGDGRDPGAGDAEPQARRSGWRAGGRALAGVSTRWRRCSRTSRSRSISSSTTFRASGAKDPGAIPEILGALESVPRARPPPTTFRASCSQVRRRREDVVSMRSPVRARWCAAARHDARPAGGRCGGSDVSAAGRLVTGTRRPVPTRRGSSRPWRATAPTRAARAGRARPFDLPLDPARDLVVLSVGPRRRRPACAGISGLRPPARPRRFRPRRRRRPPVLRRWTRALMDLIAARRARGP